MTKAQVPRNTRATRRLLRPKAPSEDPPSGSPAPGTSTSLAKIARGQWGIESVHWLRDTAWAEDASTGYAGNGPQIMATPRNLAVSLLYLAGACRPAW
jgi:hypothetical protein